MAKTEYLIAERRPRYGGKYSFYADGYGFSNYEDSFLNTLGRDGWELVSDSGTEMRFKRIVEEKQYDYYEPEYVPPRRKESTDNQIDYSKQIETLLDLNVHITNGMKLLEEELEKAKYRETLLVSLVQELAEKIAPDSFALAALNQVVDPNGEIAAARKQIEKQITEDTASSALADQQVDAATNGNNIPKTAKNSKDAFIEDSTIAGFADEQIEIAMRNYQDGDNSLNLFAFLVGFGFTLSMQTAKDHQRYMLKALYRYYTKHADERIAECYVVALRKASQFLSSAETIEQLNNATQSSITIIEATDAFFNLVITQLECEKQEIAPVTVSQLAEYVEDFITNVNSDAVLQEDTKLITKIKEYLTCLQQTTGDACYDRLAEIF